MKIKLPFVLMLFACFCGSVLNAQLKLDKKKGKAKTLIGGEQAVGQVKDHLAEGIWITYYPKSAGKNLVHYKIQYKTGYKNGSSTEYFPDGSIKVAGHYVNGMKMGHWQENYPNGKIHFTYSWLNDTIHGEQMTFFTDGKRSKREVYDRGQLTAYEEWSTFGILSRGEYFENGKRNGRCYWNDTGRDSTMTNYCDYHYGQKNGEERLVAHDGIITVTFYGLDVKNGTYLKTSHTGRLIESGMYDNGRMIGLWVYVRPNGERKLVYHGALPRQKGDVRLITEQPEPAGFDSCVDLYKSGKVRMIQRAINRPSEFYSATVYDTNGVKSATGFMRGGKKDSLWTTYFPNKKVSSTVRYDANGPKGEYKVWYPNGKLMLKVPLSNGRVYDLLTFYDEKGKAQPFNTKEAEDALRPWFYPNTDVHWEKFEHMEQISNDEEGPVLIAEQMPEFPGGQAEMAKFLQRNIIYPVIAKEAGIQGKVFISFVVRKDGSITDVQVIKSVDPSLDREALRVVNMMPHWTPGMINGKPVNVKFNLPINFVLK